MLAEPYLEEVTAMTTLLMDGVEHTDDLDMLVKVTHVCVKDHHWISLTSDRHTYTSTMSAMSTALTGKIHDIVLQANNKTQPTWHEHPCHN